MRIFDFSEYTEGSVSPCCVPDGKSLARAPTKTSRTGLTLPVYTAVTVYPADRAETSLWSAL